LADLNIPKELEKVCQLLQNASAEIDMIVINGRTSLHLSDLGLNAELIKTMVAQYMVSGVCFASFNTLVDIEEPFTATITANGQTVERVAEMIVIANSKKYGTGVIINPSGIMNDGKFELVFEKY
jgi:diacylglycerol kinase family enzyme